MATDLLLIIDHRETRVRMDGRALRIDRPEHPPEHVPLGLIGLVVVHGSPLVGCEVWRELAERNIPAVVQPARGRGCSALIGAALGSTIQLRIAQHQGAADQPVALGIARRLIASKIAAQSEVTTRLDPTSVRGRELIRLLQDNLDKLHSTPAASSILGLEGSAAAGWYDWLAHWLADRQLDKWRFAGRNRRPPRDPINALLSLGYTLLGGEVLRAVQEQGLDPALGYLHGVVPGRESLVLDLMEPLRPSVDLFVIGLIDGILVPTQFTYSARDGCRLNKSGRAAFYREWALARSDWPDLAIPHRVDGSAPTSASESGDGELEHAPGEVTTLPDLCRYQVSRLRGWLKPRLTEPLAPDAPS